MQFPSCGHADGPWPPGEVETRVVSRALRDAFDAASTALTAGGVSAATLAAPAPQPRRSSTAAQMARA